MKHERTIMATIEGFGRISRCTCGQYTVQVPGASLHLKEEGFRRLVQLILSASNADVPKQRSQRLRVVKP